ncbi:hypothetical protein BC829DRAFT_378548 [Chytridium lagenaria]|nr:hypothetical protein BC829DRAFT_378548 [Chytridium lagenaria]
MNDDDDESSPVAQIAPVSWTKEETKAVLKFYGLKTLEVQTWEDEDAMTDVIKQLVKQHFAKFVNAKSTIDAFYEEIRSNNLTNSETEGLTPFSTCLKKRAKVDRLRAALGVLEHCQRLQQRKYLMESSFSSAATSESVKGDNELESADAGAKIFFPKNHKRRSLPLKKICFSKLDSTNTPLEPPKRIMTYHFYSIWVELSADKDPVWYYLTNQYKLDYVPVEDCVYFPHARNEAIMAIADAEASAESLKIPTLMIQNIARETYCSPEERITIKRTGRLSLSDFKRAISSVQTKEYEISFGRYKTGQAVCKIMRSSLLDFWRLCRIYSEDRIQKMQNSKAKRRADVKKMMQCQSMLRNITDILMGELVRCFDEVRIMRVGGGTTIEERVCGQSEMQPMVLKKRVTESIGDGIVYESRKLYEYEDWSFDPDPRNSAGILEKSIDETERPKPTEDDEAIAIACGCYPIFTAQFLQIFPERPLLEHHADTAVAPVTSSSKGQSGSSVSGPVPHALMEKVLFAFSESCLGLLDGMEWLATRWIVTEEEDEDLLQTLEKLKMEPHRKLDGSNFLLIAGEDDIGRRQRGNISLLEKKRKAIDTRKIDSRALVIICNLAYLRDIVIPKLVALIELKFRTTVANEVQTLNDAVEYLDSILFNNYVRRKAMKISSLIRHGILYSGLDFNDLARLQEIRPYCYDTLMIFVLAHSEVSDASRRLIRRVLSELLQILAQDLLINFRQIDKFGVAGKMQATLETEFLHQTLAAYENSSISETLKMVYTTIDLSSDKVEMTLPELQDSVKAFLKSAKEATAMQFLCFKDSTATSALMNTISSKASVGR